MRKVGVVKKEKARKNRRQRWEEIWELTGKRDDRKEKCMERWEVGYVRKNTRGESLIDKKKGKKTARIKNLREVEDRWESEENKIVNTMAEISESWYLSVRRGSF